MTAQIIQFGTATRQQYSAQARSTLAQRAEAFADRDVRVKAWDRAASVTSFYKALLELIEATWIAKRCGAELAKIDHDMTQAAFPGDFIEDSSIRNRALAELRKAGLQQLLTPAGLQSHLDWKLTQIRAKLQWWGIDHVTELQIARIMDQDRAFLEACPRKSGGKRKRRRE